MNWFSRWIRFTSEQVTQAQRWFSFGIVFLVAVTAVYLISDGRRLTRDVEDFFNGNSFKVLGEIANLQRDWLKTQVVVRDLRLDASQDISEYIQQHSFAKISLRFINSRANSDEGIENFASRSYEILDRVNDLNDRINELSVELDLVSGNPVEMNPILDEIDDHLGEAEVLINELYVQQEAFRITFLSGAINSVVRSRLIMIVASGFLLFLSITMLYLTQRTSAVEREAKERFQLASAAVNSAIYDWNPQYDQIIWTDGLREVFGHEIDQENSQIAGIWEHIHPDDLETVQQVFMTAQENGENFAIEHRFKTDDGVYLDVSNRVQVVADNRGLVTRMVGSLEDITERRMMLAYQESNRAKSRLLAHVSHELKTPLSAIIGYTEIVHAEVYGPVTSEQRHTFERILANARSLLDLINSLLSQARVEAREDTITLGLLDPMDLVQVMHDAVGVLAESKQLTLTHTIDGNLPPALIGDIGRLRQIVINLTGNAVKFTEEGGIHMHIYRPAPKSWAISIADTGIGISRDDQEKVFSAFTQVNDSLEADSRGFGLGLSIITQIVNNLNGTIQLKSEPGQGSTFTVTLPLIKRMEMS